MCTAYRDGSWGFLFKEPPQNKLGFRSQEYGTVDSRMKEVVVKTEIEGTLKLRGEFVVVQQSVAVHLRSASGWLADAASHMIACGWIQNGMAEIVLV